MTLILIINGRNDDSVAHEVLDADEDMDSGDMLAAETRIKRTKLGDETELTEREEPERGQPETITAEACLMRFGTTARPGKAGVDDQDNPSAAKPTRRRRRTVHTFVWILHELSRQSERFTASLPRNLALAILEEIDEAER